MQYEFKVISQPGQVWELVDPAVVRPGEDSVEKKIESFGQLEVGWDFGAGKPSSAAVIYAAKHLYQLGRNLGLRAGAFPGVAGDINVAFYATDHTVEIKVNTDLSLDLTYEVGLGIDYDEVAHKERITLSEVLNFLFRLMAQGTTWNSLGRSTWQDMIQPANASKVTRLSTMKGVYQSLTESVQRAQRPKELASTLGSFTHLPLGGTHLSFGYSTPQRLKNTLERVP